MDVLRDFLGTTAGQTFLFSLFAVPLFVVMLGRAGLPRLWALLALVPAIGPTIVFGLMALRRWPAARPLPARGGEGRG